MSLSFLISEFNFSSSLKSAALCVLHNQASLHEPLEESQKVNYVPYSHLKPPTSFNFRSFNNFLFFFSFAFSLSSPPLSLSLLPSFSSSPLSFPPLSLSSLSSSLSHSLFLSHSSHPPSFQLRSSLFLKFILTKFGKRVFLARFSAIHSFSSHFKSQRFPLSKLHICVCTYIHIHINTHIHPTQHNTCNEGSGS